MFFEVKSESDDLSGKQILCSLETEKGLRIIQGYRFLNSLDVKVFNLFVNEYEEYFNPILKEYSGKYSTDLNTIYVNNLRDDDSGRKISGDYKINRTTLEIKQGLVTDQCRIIKEDLIAFFSLEYTKRKNEYDKKIEEMKKKQKL